MYLLGLSTISDKYVDAARNLRASPRRAFWDIVVKLSKPGIVMAAMLAFVVSFSDLLSATYLGGATTLSSVLTDLEVQSGNEPAAAAVAVVMLLTILVVVVASFRVVGRVSITGGVGARGTKSYQGRVGPSIWAWRVYIVIGLLFVSTPPIILGLYGFFGPPIPIWPIPYFTTHWYAAIFSSSGMVQSLINSAKVAVAVGVGATALGGSAAYYLSRFKPNWMIPYTMLVVTPAVAPPIILSLGLLVYFVDLHIWGSLWSVVIGHIGLVAVFSLFIINNRLMQINADLEDAANNLGANRLVAVRSVTLPLVLPALVTSFVVAAGISFGESVVSFFLTATTYTWPAYTLNLVGETSTPVIYAAAGFVYGCVLLVFAAVGLLLLRRGSYSRQAAFKVKAFVAEKAESLLDGADRRQGNRRESPAGVPNDSS